MPCISIHPPHAGRDEAAAAVIDRFLISIHPPHAGRDLRASRTCTYQLDFNPPSPCGEGPLSGVIPAANSRFQSTLPMRGGTVETDRGRPSSEDFNPPSPCGEGLVPGSTINIDLNFNPPSPCGEGQHKFTKYIWKLMHISQNKPLTKEHTAKHSKFSPILWRILQFSFMRTYRGISVCFPFASLNNQHPLRLIGRFRTEMLNFCLIAVSQIVKSQTVLLLIHDPTQLML